MADTSAVVHLTSQNFDQTLTDAGDKPVLVDFFATWCGPCQMAAPVIEQLSTEYAGKAVIAKVDVDQEPELAQRYQVVSIPTVIVFRAKNPVAQKVGFAGKEGYVDMITSAMAPSA